MAKYDKEVEKILKIFDPHIIKKEAENEEKDIVNIEKKAWASKTKVLATHIKKGCELTLRAYAIMGSRLAVESFMDETQRKWLIESLEENVRLGLGMVNFGLSLEEKHFQHSPFQANMITNTRTMIENTLGYLKLYVRKVMKGWDGKGPKVMIEEVTRAYEQQVSYMDQAILRELPAIKRHVHKFKDETDDRLQEALKKAA